MRSSYELKYVQSYEMKLLEMQILNCKFIVKLSNLYLNSSSQEHKRKLMGLAEPIQPLRTTPLI